MDTGQFAVPKPIAVFVSDTEVVPDPMLDKRTRHRFSTEYKLPIIVEAVQCRRGGSALLRRANLYSDQLQTRCKQLVEGGEQALSRSAPGPHPKLTTEQRELKTLRLENAKLRRKLKIVND